MTEFTSDLSLAQAHSLIGSYAFDLGGDDVEQLLENWLNIYDPSWIRLATIEALYLGRYKAISIKHILDVWLRMGTSNPHFTYEFERLICRKLPKHLSDLSNSTPSKIEERIEDQTDATPQNHSANLPPSTISDETLDHQEVSVSKSSFNKIPLISALRFSQHADWTEFTRGDNKIHNFIPLPDVSSLFDKLKTFGEEKLES